MDVVILIGRILFVGLFLGSALAHLTQTTSMAGYAQSRGVPSSRSAVIVSGLLILAGAIMVLFGIWGDLGALFLVAFLVPTAFMMHNFWRESDPMARQMEMVQFQKDLALAGAALMVFALYASGEVGIVIIGPLFDLG